MKAAYKWKIQNGIYGYITDEENYGPFIYEDESGKRTYSGSTETGTSVNDGYISSIVSNMSKDEYVTDFDKFKELVLSRYPYTQFLDTIYYYKVEYDECAVPQCSEGSGSGQTYYPGRNITINGMNKINAEGYTYRRDLTSFAIVGNTASGQYSFAEGDGTTADGYVAHAEGERTQASGNASHAEGSATLAQEAYSHAEGVGTKALGYASHTEGYGTMTTNLSAHAEGRFTRAMGIYSHTEGEGDETQYEDYITLDNVYVGKFDTDVLKATYMYINTADQNYHKFAVGQLLSVTDGINTDIRVISDILAFTETDPPYRERHRLTISKYDVNNTLWRVNESEHTFSFTRYSITFGTAIGSSSHAEGKSMAVGDFAHAQGYNTMALGRNSFSSGEQTQAKGTDSMAHGQNTIADYHFMTALGRYNRTTGYYPELANYYNTHWETEEGVWPYQRGQELLSVGYGDEQDKRRTIFKVIGQFQHNNSGEYWWGEMYTNYVICWEVNANRNNVIGNDYAEYLEWFDGNPNNEDRVGRFVKLNGDKIEIANKGDDVIGVVSSTPGVLGNAAENEWNNKYKKDIFGRKIILDKPQNIETKPNIDASGRTHNINDIQLENVANYELNPDYNPSEEYIPRSKRKEWSAVGFMGQFVVIDDGTCKVGKRCVVGDGGIATATTATTKGYRVMKRLDDTHIKIIVTSF